MDEGDTRSERHGSPMPERHATGQEVIQLTWDLAERFRERYLEKAAAVGISAAQAKLLKGLDPDSPQSMRYIAQCIKVDPSNLTALVDKLQNRGLVERRDSPRDRRTKELVITPAGDALISRFRASLTEDLGPLSELSAKQLVTLRDLLRAIMGPTSTTRG